jgi:hypothetical protein
VSLISAFRYIEVDLCARRQDAFAVASMLHLRSALPAYHERRARFSCVCAACMMSLLAYVGSAVKIEPYLFILSRNFSGKPA